MTAPTLIWFRRDLRLSDNAALTAACEGEGPVIPVHIRDSLVDGLGAAPKFRLELGIEALAESLEDKGSRLILRSGDALEALRALIRETGATRLCWSRAYDPDSIARDTRIKAALEEDGVEVVSQPGHLLFEPWTVQTKEGGFYKVFTPYWRAVRGRDVGPALSAPDRIPAPETWPDSDRLADWHLSAAMDRGADIVRAHALPSEQAAQARLGNFVARRIQDYAELRDFPAADATSDLSENLSLGEISPRQCWHAGQRAMEEGKAGAETFLKELAWREFAYHLLYHAPSLPSENWREGWNDFPWKDDERLAEIRAWKEARTGVPIVDAAMRELYVTGRMHNRSRMIVASYLTKHLLVHWRVGLKWFEDTLIDWDPANNALGWQWVAGSGPDASPYFRIFNPATQREKFDPDKTYLNRWLPMGERPSQTALAFYEAVPRHWKRSAEEDYPQAPVVDLKEGRARALAAYEDSTS
ncbi:deoxyribodipyrimidine photo-lyase [Aquicoccus sp. SCR17]|nr:deoxyribodipyrimidine photo-lyase [Carideicomes alvinocaridis]